MGASARPFRLVYLVDSMKNNFLGVVGALRVGGFGPNAARPAHRHGARGGVGAAAPLFSAKDANGWEQDLKKLLKKGPVVR